MIRLRPYFLYSLLRQLDAGDKPIEENSLPSVARRLVDSRFQEEIQLVQTFCDACEACVKMRPDPQGSLWGKGHRCKSTDTAKRLNEVENQMRGILYDLEMRFGDVMRADLLIVRAIERRPFHYFHSPELQAAYERGVRVFTRLTGLCPEIPDELRARRDFYR